MRLCALSASSFKYFLAHTPVEGDGRHGVNAGKYGCDGEKVVEAAVARAEVPLVVNGVGEVDDRVERRHAGFSKGQVHLQGGVDGGGHEGDMCKYEPQHMLSFQGNLYLWRTAVFSAQLLKCLFLFRPHSSANLHVKIPNISSLSF